MPSSSSTTGTAAVDEAGRITGVLDLLITDALVIDGSGTPAWRGSVGVAGGRIVEVRRAQEAESTSPAQPAPEAAQTVDATGLALAPGFIDVHTHSDLAPFTDLWMDSALRQGVTTVVVGNCGMSAWPRGGLEPDGVVPRHDLRGAARRGTCVRRLPPRHRRGAAGVQRGRARGLRQPADTGDGPRAPAGNAGRDRRDAPAAGRSHAGRRLRHVERAHLRSRHVRHDGGGGRRRRGRRAAWRPLHDPHARRGPPRVRRRARGRRHRPPCRGPHPRQPPQARGAPRLGSCCELLALRRRDGGATGTSTRTPPGRPTSRASCQHGRRSSGSPRLVADPDSPRPARARHRGGRARLGELGRRLGLGEHRARGRRTRHSPTATWRASAAERGVAPVDLALDLLCADPLTRPCAVTPCRRTTCARSSRAPTSSSARTAWPCRPEGPLGQTPLHPRSYGTFPRVLGRYARDARAALARDAVRKMTVAPGGDLRPRRPRRRSPRARSPTSSCSTRRPSPTRPPSAMPTTTRTASPP